MFTHSWDSSEELFKEEALNFLESADPKTLIKWRKISFDITRKYYSNIITYTTNLFIPLTFLCRNTCSYCGFRKSKIELGAEFLSIDKIRENLLKAQEYGLSEILITMGDKPETKYPNAQKWLEDHGFRSTIEYTKFIAQLCLEDNLLPHINAGSLSFSDYYQLKAVSASMGLMLENSSFRLSEIGMPHHKSPDKHPKVRLQSLRDAGRLKIPFTTGLLIGIGEHYQEIINSLLDINRLFEKYGHIQEVIIQNFNPHPNSLMNNYPPASLSLMEKIIILARIILQPEISIQVPPNLLNGSRNRFINAGISDWGGLSPLTPDYINPNHKWPNIDYLAEISAKSGKKMKERLPIYPRYLNLGWISSKVRQVITEQELSTEDGYRKRAQ
ncbi:7,8-didemethyl-8-hydroxy-5-deazariboflavin synthase CofG [Candidatus Hodarchaeum mangrovi]